MSKSGEQTKPSFICAALKRLEDGCVARCDNSPHHIGKHCDSVIAVAWEMAVPPAAPVVTEESKCSTDGCSGTARYCLPCCLKWPAAPDAVVSQPACQLCGEPMPEGEEMFNYHGYSGPCPKPPLAHASDCPCFGDSTANGEVVEHSKECRDCECEYGKSADWRTQRESVVSQPEGTDDLQWALDTIMWMSGSMDFAPGGQAHEGWKKTRGRLHKILDAKHRELAFPTPVVSGQADKRSLYRSAALAIERAVDIAEAQEILFDLALQPAAPPSLPKAGETE